MLLAGGKGTRLHQLTEKVAKPAVPFGGKYRIIDFVLSNCTNSNIDTVGILTQYQPLLLNSYIGIGSAWDLDRKDGGVTVLPPYLQSDSVKWYEGTANAVYQNLNYLDEYNPEYVLILSGDHIYKMDYAEMLDHHIKAEADVSISVIEVPWDEASRFGILNTDENLEVMEFDEKPKQPKSNLASMGIYIFKYDVLKKFLMEDEENPNSSHDFGKDIIPSLLECNKKVIAYPFKGYWKDVGTIKSLWEANMDLLDETSILDLFDRDWKVYSVNPNDPPQYIAPHANVKDSFVNEGCVINGTVEHSVLFQGVEVAEGTVIKDSVIMPNAKIGKNVIIERTIIAEDVEIKDYSIIRPSVDGEDVLLISAKKF